MSEVSAVTRPGLLATSAIAASVAAMPARLAGLGSTLMKDQTPVPLSSLPVATDITLSIAVLRRAGGTARRVEARGIGCVARCTAVAAHLMDQKMTAFGAAERGCAVAFGAMSGPATKDSAGASARHRTKAA